MLSTPPCRPLPSEPHIPPPSLWLRLLKAPNTTQVLILSLLTRLQNMSQLSARNISNQDFSIPNFFLPTQRRSYIRCPAVCFQILFPSSKVRARRTSFRRFLPRFRRFAPTADFRLLSLRRRKSSEPKRFSTSFSASGIRRSPRNLKAS